MLNGGLDYPGADFIIQRIKHELDRSQMGGEWGSIQCPLLGMPAALFIDSAMCNNEFYKG